MLKRVLKSRVWWLILGVLLHAWVLQRFPKGTWRGLGGWLWENKAILAVGILIGIALCVIIRVIRNGFGGIHFRSPITRVYDDEDDDEV